MTLKLIYMYLTLIRRKYPKIINGQRITCKYLPIGPIKLV